MHLVINKKCQFIERRENREQEKKNKTNNRKNTFGTKKLVIMLGSMLAKREEGRLSFDAANKIRFIQIHLYIHEISLIF